MNKRRTVKQMAHDARKEGKAFIKTNDSFTNFAARVGLGTNNLSSASRYDFDFLTRLRIQLEAAYRTSWLVGAAVDMPADDMTRAGIEFETTLPPEDIEVMQAAILDLQIWSRLASTIRWSRLFGGALGVMLIDGQDMKTPLRLETVKKDAFKGLIVLDRWQVNPSLNNLVTEMGPSMGLPKFYDVLDDAMALPSMKIHYSRIIRMEGLELPYYQHLAENLWGESVIERIHDRLVAFDSATQGAGQLVYKAHLRTYKVDKLREMIAMGGKAMEGLIKQIQMIRLYQSNEGMTLMDKTDEFDAHSYSFAGLSDIILQFGQQISGALQIPLVRLFGQSPVGLNSTGESDLRTYYDNINKQQESKLRRPLNVLLDVMSRSVLGRELPKGFKFRFNPLWQMTEKEKAEIGQLHTDSVCKAYDAGLISMSTSLRELRQNAHTSGMWSNITDDDIKDAENLPPPAELAQAAIDKENEPDPNPAEPGSVEK